MRPPTGEGRTAVASRFLMGDRALVAYERTDGTFNLHHSRWGGRNLVLKHRITEGTPFGAEHPTQWTRELHDALTAGADVERVVDRYHLDGNTLTDVDPVPRVTGVNVEAALTDHLEFQRYDAFYVVDRDLRVTPYRTLWLSLEFVSRLVSDLDLSHDVERHARRVLEEATEAETVGKRPSGVAGGAVLVAAAELDESVFQIDVAEVADVSPPTVREWRNELGGGSHPLAKTD